jgi:hypothetical protein
MVIGTGDKSIEQILKTIDKLADNPDELAYWTTALETAARNMCKDENENIIFIYCPDEKVVRLFLKDNKSRDCLIKSIEIQLPLIPESLKGFFSVLKYNLKNVKYNK